MSRWMPEAAALERLRRWRPVWRRGPRQDLLVLSDACWHIGSGKRLADVEAWCEAHAGQRLRLVLGGAQQQHLCCDAALPLEDEQAVATWARHQFTHFHGPAASEWAVAPWCLGEQRGATAYPRQTLAVMTAAAQRHGVLLDSVIPWWALALWVAGAADPALATVPSARLWLVEGSLVTLLKLESGRLISLANRWLDAPRHASLLALLEQTGQEEALLLQQDGQGHAVAAVPVTAQWLLGHGLEDSAPTIPGLRLMGRLDQTPAELLGAGR